MSYNREAILDDLAPFADLGTEAPIAVQGGSSLIVRLIREGTPIELKFSEEGSVEERRENKVRKHAHLRALLASPSFANLARWADSQRVLLRSRVTKDTIPVVGRLAGSETASLSDFDSFLKSAQENTPPRTLVALIDGPAGIGKTSVIRSLSYRRAERYRADQSPLILHVESRGRVLQNLTDLMAFSLQTLRLSVTYDQVPSLVRAGLVTLAIDGFDELGDPNGYELAWAQVNDMITSSRGRGCIILSGRETFISEERMRSALSALDEKSDRLAAYNLLPLNPATAKDWLAQQGWPEDLLNSDMAAPLFEQGSYALRPFFLTELAREGVSNQIAEGEVENLLGFLVTAMTQREAEKFGRDVEAVTTPGQRQEFVKRLMQEVARDLAENQSDSIPVDSLSWIAEVVADGLVPGELTGILKNRAGVVAFLTDDERRGFRRFIHDQVLNYFLAHVTIRTIADGDVPKYVRRNIFGIEFLESFAGVVRHLDQGTVDQFVVSAGERLRALSDQDRGRQNLAALVIATCSVTVPSVPPIIEDVSFDEVYCTESLSPITLQRVTIAQLHARSADLRSMQFDESCFVISLVADDGTIPPAKFPRPAVVSLPTGTVSDPDQIESWYRKRLLSFMPQSDEIDVGNLIKQLPLFNLLARMARYKPYWLKDGEEKSARRILDDPDWEVLKEVMLQHGLLVERFDVPAAGRPAPFYHFKNRTAFLQLEHPPEAVVPFLRDLLEASLDRGDSIDF